MDVVQTHISPSRNVVQDHSINCSPPAACLLLLPAATRAHYSPELERKHECVEGSLKEEVELHERPVENSYHCKPRSHWRSMKGKADVKRESITGSFKMCLLLRPPQRIACGQHCIHQKWEQKVRGEEKIALTLKTQMAALGVIIDPLTMALGVRIFQKAAWQMPAGEE